ncbi:helix-turn-helix transcriptional regulator [Alcaligenes sp. SDU_A2]|uniref:helix-turn-helix transcriptional regulator n=1 Tax=Alcaligenes sp. SDU_A2 TaxID=3136634 RepID=UPI002BA12DCB|nr:helix-turn-helix transcriptional regulator [Alcaligenes sp.]HRL26729.1 helix-turn-helix transcriptional regulator [Alcaligenes sp.]
MSKPRTRPALAQFLQAQRRSLNPADYGFPTGGRRRTPGLRREEVAALAGVGLAWYTWLEQGRGIGVSEAFLERLAQVFRLGASERRHLFLLACQRPPVESGRSWCQVPPLVRRLMQDLHPHPAYMLNLRWDVLAWNPAAQALFGFEDQPAGRRNRLWMLFTDERTRVRMQDWKEQLPGLVAGFRRDFVAAQLAPDFVELVNELERVSPEFKVLWRQQDIQQACRGRAWFGLEGQPMRQYEHTTLIVDQDKHLRLQVHVPVEEADYSDVLVSQ